MILDQIFRMLNKNYFYIMKRNNRDFCSSTNFFSQPADLTILTQSCIFREKKRLVNDVGILV